MSTRRGVAHLSPEAIDLVAARFRVLAEPQRLRILQFLRGGEKNVTEITEELQTTQPNVSKHLRVLQEAGLVGRRQSRNTVYCFIADSTVFDLCDVVCSSLYARVTAHAQLLGGTASARRR